MPFFAKKPIEFSTLAFRNGAVFSRKYFLSMVRVKIYSNFIFFFYIIIVVTKVSPLHNMQVTFPFHQKLIRSVISPQGDIIDLIHFFSHLAIVYQTFWVSVGLVWYLWKSLTPKFGLLNLRLLNGGRLNWGDTVVVVVVMITFRLEETLSQGLSWTIYFLHSLRISVLWIWRLITASTKVHSWTASWATSTSLHHHKQCNFKLEILFYHSSVPIVLVSVKTSPWGFVMKILHEFYVSPFCTCVCAQPVLTYII
jgi:hypothetical protein